MKLKIKRLSEDAVLPSRAHSTDAGLDLTATSKKWDFDKKLYIYGTGLAIAIPEGHVGLIFPRSSICKKTLSLANSVGVIDSGYSGEILFMFRDTSRDTSKDFYAAYNVGDRIGQLVVLELPKFEVLEVDDLDETDRGTGGFGSSGV